MTNQALSTTLVSVWNRWYKYFHVVCFSNKNTSLPKCLLS